MRDVEFRNRLLLNEVKEEKLEALFFENPMDCRCQDVTVEKPGKNICLLRKERNIPKSRCERR